MPTLKKAIKLHAKHMAGTAPTEGKEGMKSQMKMNKQMKDHQKAMPKKKKKK